MGEIQTRIDFEKDLTVNSVSGEITAAEVRAKIVEYYEGEVTGSILWDFSKAEIHDVTLEDVQELVELSNSYASRRIGGKTALVFSSASGFGLGRMFDIQKSIVAQPVNHASFRSLADALEWLGADAR